MRGKVWKYGDHIDTDVIIPARYLNNPDPKALASHCMVDIDEGFAGSVQPGDIMVGGWNFGCGSSREHAPIAIKASGISCVIASTAARAVFPVVTEAARIRTCLLWTIGIRLSRKII